MLTPTEIYEMQKTAARFLNQLIQNGVPDDELGMAARNVLEFIDFAEKEGK